MIPNQFVGIVTDFVFGSRTKKRRAQRRRREFLQAQAAAAFEQAKIQRDRFIRSIPGQRAGFAQEEARRFGASTGSVIDVRRQEFETRLGEDQRLAELGFNVERMRQAAVGAQLSAERAESKHDVGRALFSAGASFALGQL